jgi:hypothetical protein
VNKKRWTRSTNQNKAARCLGGFSFASRGRQAEERVTVANRPALYFAPMTVGHPPEEMAPGWFIQEPLSSLVMLLQVVLHHRQKVNAIGRRIDHCDLVGGDQPEG